MALLVKARHWMIALGLLAFVLLAVVGLYLTRDGRVPAQGKGLTRRTPLVDEQPLQTARNMAKLASTWEELRYAQQALKLADHEVDLAFTDAMRDASEHPAPATAETKALYARVKQSEATVKAEQDRIDQLKKQLATANATRQDNLQAQLSIVQAQMELDQDELDDAKGDLVRSGADPLTRIQRQFNRHEAAQQSDASRTSAPPDTSTPPQRDSLVSHITTWRALHTKTTELLQAQTEASSNAAKLSETHDALEKQVSAEQADKQAITQEATTQLVSTQDGDVGGSSGETAAALTTLHVLSIDQKDLADLDKRIQDHQELSTNYGNWIELLKSSQISSLHGVIKCLLWIFLIAFAVYLAQRALEHFLRDLSPEHTRYRTLRIIVRFAVQAIGLLGILFVIFGTPSQLSTVLGLAGAGLTVALQDFIISFLGWFVLMGRNGIRVGDWVEINGVAGEVVEIGLLRTVLLETGNWTDAGHPTGRKVALMNSYAIQGRFFNFSTTGQWLWDELQVTVPANEDPYPIIEAVQQIVVKETEADTRAAEEEWKQATNRYRVQSVSATPAINLRPTGAGIEVHVRYITRANERYAVRTRLYQAVVELLHRRGVDASPTVSASAASAKR
jgi:small-conductance mechanosensitive channel